MKKRISHSIRVKKTAKKSISKFGGTPDLPPSVSHPVAANNIELDFLTQIHFPEIPYDTELPQAGTLFVFYNNSAEFKVIYSEEPLPESKEETAKVYKEIFIDFELINSAKNIKAPCHQMLGRPYGIQRDDINPNDILLLQLDSDFSGPGWLWGDAGLLYFFISPEDLRSKRFDRTKAVRECC